MSKLNKDELLKDLAFVLSTWKRHYPHKLPPMRILQIFENFQQIKEMIQKPGITEEFMGKWVEKMFKFFNTYGDYSTYRFLKASKVNFGIFIKQMFKEAGIKIQGEK